MSEVLDKVLEAAKSAAETVATKVETVAKEVAEAPKEELKKFVSLATAEEKLVLKETELEYLKLQMQIKDLQTKAEALSSKYKTTVDGYFEKYAIDKTKYIFDGLKSGFSLIEAGAKQFLKKL